MMMSFRGSFVPLFSVLFISLALWLFPHYSQAQNSSAQDYLNAHNAARAEVGVANITWDSTVAAYALIDATSRVSDCNLVPSNGSYGENLANGNGSLSGSSAVNSWVSEKQNYDYSSNSCVGGPCSEYTQVVWSSSVRVGCAEVQCANGLELVTCNYDPPGNSVGQRPY